MKSINKDECWLFAGNLGDTGYGEIHFGGKTTKAHRAMYEAHKGKIPEGLVIDHLCMVKACINPEHLEAVTSDENARRYFATITHCKRGHPLTPDNITVKKKTPNWRVCKTCHNMHNKQSYYKSYFKGKFGPANRRRRERLKARMEGIYS